MAKKSPLLPIFLIVLVDILGLTIILPLLPFYAEKYGASASTVGLLITLYAACQLFSGPLLGRISDHMGRRPLLLVSQVGTFIGLLTLGFAQTLWVIFLSRFIDGITAGNLSLAQAYISDVTEPKDRSKSFALIGIAFGVGFLIGPAISGYLSQFGYSVPVFLAAGLSATSIAATYFLLPTVKPGELEGATEEPLPAGRRLSLLGWGNYVKFFKDAGLASLLLQFFLFCFAFSTFNSGFALFAERRYLHHGHPFGPKEVGYVLAYAGFLGILLQGGMIGRLVKKYGEKALVFSGFVAAAFGYAILGYTYSIPSLLLITLFMSFGTGVLRPTLTSLVTQQVKRTEQGVILGLTQSLNSVAQIIAPIIAGVLIQHDWLRSWSFVAAVTMAIGIALSRYSKRFVILAAHEEKPA